MHARKQGESKGDGLRLISHCPLCKTSYDPLEAKVLSERDDAHLLHISCRKCENAVLALIFISSSGISSVGLITDCSYDDVVRFREGNEVNADDAIAFHELMGRGNFITALKNS